MLPDDEKYSIACHKVITFPNRKKRSTDHELPVGYGGPTDTTAVAAILKAIPEN